MSLFSGSSWLILNVGELFLRMSVQIFSRFLDYRGDNSWLMKTAFTLFSFINSPSDCTFPFVKKVEEWILRTLTRELLAIEFLIILLRHSWAKSSSLSELRSTINDPFYLIGILTSYTPDMPGKCINSPFCSVVSWLNSQPSSLIWEVRSAEF